MSKTPDKPPKRAPIEARRRPDADREALIEDIERRFSKTLGYLAR